MGQVEETFEEEQEDHRSIRWRSNLRQFGWVHPRSFAVWKRSRSKLLARVQKWTKPRKDRCIESLQFLLLLSSRCFVMLFRCSAAAVSFRFFIFVFGWHPLCPQMRL